VIAPERIEEVAAKLEAALAAGFGCEVVTKGESVLHRAIATAFDVVENARVKVAELASFVSLDPPRTGLPTGDEYLEDFATTIGSTIALPATWRAPGGALSRLLVLPHETVHVTQHEHGVDAGWWPRVTSHSVLYLASVATDDAAEYLGHVEADAYATTECVRAWLSGGARRPVGETVDNLRRHYAIKPAGADVAEATLRSHYATMEDGGLPNVTVCRWAIAWLDANAADLRGQVIA
jgi:hypothetical protein